MFCLAMFSAYSIIQERWAKPEDPRHEQFRTSGAPESSGPSSRHSQHDAPSGGDGARLADGEKDDGDVLIIMMVGVESRDGEQ